MGKQLHQQNEEPSYTPGGIVPVGQEIVPGASSALQDTASSVCENAIRLSERETESQDLQEAEDIHALLHYAAEKPRTLPWYALTPLALAMLYSIFNLILNIRSIGLGGFLSLWYWFLSLPLQLLVPGAILWYASATHADHQEDMEIGELDVRWVGELVEALNDPNRRVRNMAKRLLARLLPRLKPSDTALLSPIHWRELYGRLLKNKLADADLTVAILRAVARFGDLEALPCVEHLAEEPTLLPKQRYVQRAARRCLTELESRFEAQHAVVAIPPSTAQVGALLITEASHDTIPTEEMGLEPREMPEEVAALIEELKEQRRKNGQPGIRKGFLIASWCSIVPLTGWQSALYAMQGNWPAALAWGAGCGLATQLHRFALSSKRTEAAQKLAAYDELKGVGVFAEALEWHDAEMQAVAKFALIRLLPRLRASDAGLLDATQRGCLHRMLRMSNALRDGDLLLAILRALQQVGDNTAIPHVERLSKSVALVPTQKKIKQAAIDCLPLLANRAELKRVSDTLLRASASEPADPTLLLRPAADTGASDPQQLLRAGLTTNETSR